MQFILASTRIALLLALITLFAACAPTVYLPRAAHASKPGGPGQIATAVESAKQCKVALVVDRASYRASGYRLRDYPESVAALTKTACTQEGECKSVTLFNSWEQARMENKFRVDAGGEPFDYYIVMSPGLTSFRSGIHLGMIGPQFIIIPVLEPFLPAPFHPRYAKANVNWRLAAYDRSGELLCEKKCRWRKKKTFPKSLYYSKVCMSWAMRPLARQLADYMDEETGAFLHSSIALTHSEDKISSDTL